MKDTDVRLIPILFFFITTITRIPFTSHYPLYSDSIHFSLAIEKYDIKLHQPHPPGYFLYVILGKIFNHLFHDPNETFIFISIIFSGLSISIIYILAKEIYDKKIALISAGIALTSPVLWFHGEIALTYIVDAFFSTLVALLCWRNINGKKKYAWISAILMGISGGIRQSTPFFLFPLWLYSMKGTSFKILIISLLLFGISSALWFFPMIWMTGGWEAYKEAFYDILQFQIVPSSVFQNGYVSLKVFSYTILNFTILGLGAGFFVLCLGIYSLIRSGDFLKINHSKVFFFFMWIAPSVIFYLLVHIHPANPGYILIILPSLIIITSSLTLHVCDRIKKLLNLKISLLPIIVSLIITANAAFFFLYPSIVSYKWIKTHDRALPMLINGIRGFNPKKSIVCVKPYIFYGYRHIMYYLPEFKVYELDHRVFSDKVRNIFGGINRLTFLTDNILIQKDVENLVVPLLDDDLSGIPDVRGVKVFEVFPGIYILSLPVNSFRAVFPEIANRIKFLE